jgi:hemerythrin-like metal-binding protein
MLFTWNDTYNTGIATIDTQHKKLVDILNRLYAAMEKGQARDVLGKLLDELVQYTVVHFSTEEGFFARYGYLETISHKKEHENFKAKALALQKDFASGKTTISAQVGAFLKDWLSHHILQIDKKYAPFLVSKGVK